MNDISRPMQTMPTRNTPGGTRRAMRMNRVVQRGFESRATAGLQARPGIFAAAASVLRLRLQAGCGLRDQALARRTIARYKGACAWPSVVIVRHSRV